MGHTVFEVYVRERMAQRGNMSERELARRAGIKPATLRYYLSDRWPATRMPAQDILVGIADALGEPVHRVIEAARETVQGPDQSNGTLTPDQQVVVNAMLRLDARGQRMVADIVLLLVGEWVRHADRARGEGPQDSTQQVEQFAPTRGTRPVP